jgi:hypothetical protein
MSTGQTWATVCTDWDLPLLGKMTRYWEKNPPPHVCLKVMAQEMRLELPKESDTSTGEGKPDEGDSTVHAMLQTAMMQPRKLDPNAVREGKF